MADATSNPSDAIPLPGVHSDVPEAGVYVEPGELTAFDVKAGIKRTISLATLIAAEDDHGIMAFAQILYLRDILSASAATEKHMRQAVNAASGAQANADEAIETAMAKVAGLMKKFGAGQGGFDAEDIAAAMRGDSAEASPAGGTPA